MLFRRTRGPMVIGLVLCCGGLVGVAGAATITEFAIPTPNSGPAGITAGPDGALWFTESSTNKIGRITTDGAITEFGPFASISFFLGDITAGPDGALWFTAFDQIGRITTAGTITVFSPPAAATTVPGITAGPDGALWFTEHSAQRIGRITPAGAITEFSLPTANSAPLGITAGPDGALWFAEEVAFAKQNGNKIGRITPAGAITEFSLPALSLPVGITAGPDGALWFTESAGKIGRITTDGTITEFSLPAPISFLGGITAGPDGALWFAENSTNKIGRITPTGTVTEFAIPTAGSSPGRITAGPDGALWFTEPGANKIGRIVPDLSAALLLNGSAFHTGQTITYQATLTPGSPPPQVDIYLGALLPDGGTFLSLVEASPGVISIALGPAPIPFRANVTLTQTVVPFSYTFGGSEPAGTYFTYAGLAVAGSNPFVPANQLSLGVQPFQFAP